MAQQKLRDQKLMLEGRKYLDLERKIMIKAMDLSSRSFKLNIYYIEEKIISKLETNNK